MRKSRIAAIDQIGDTASKTVALSFTDSAARLKAVEDSGAYPIATHDGGRVAASAAVQPARGKLASPAEPGLPPQPDAFAVDDAEAQIGAQPALLGNIDEATWTTIEGWVWDPEAPEERIRLELVEGETQLAMAVASDDRPDLVQAGVGDGRHGFSIELKPGLLAEGGHILHLRCVDTRLAVPGSPIILQSSAEAPAPAFRWHLDQITDAEVSGWISMPDDPMRHCVLVLKEADRIHARSVASRFRPDLLAAGIGDGCYGFSLQMPSSLLDGENHLLEIVEEHTGHLLTGQPIRWRSAAGTAGLALTGIAGEIAEVGAGNIARWPTARHPPRALRADYEALQPHRAPSKRPAASGKPDSRTAAPVGMRMLFDVSDLVYYIAEHSNLTGIQRVQSSIVLAMIDGKVLTPSATIFLSFNAKTRNWVTIPTGFLISLLRDLFLPKSQRLISFPAEDARYGVLPGAQPFDGSRVLDDGIRSVLCLLGAAWVHQDYLHRVLALKRRFGTRFVMTVHDLIPIYARETCDQDTARVFEEFMRRALRHVDHILAVSENTAKDVRRYLAKLQLPEPVITVTKNGSSFAEFLPKSVQAGAVTLHDLPERFVLFVATIEGRKNHQLIFDLWRRMVEEGDDPPHLICVGRLGWKATAFVSTLVETNYLDGRIHLLRETSDTDLRILYDRCLFTLCPSLYEGWGLPVGESLAMDKICVSSDRAAIPEVAGDCGVYIDIDSVDQSLKVIRDLIHNEKARTKLEAKIRREFTPITWRSVAEKVVAACETSLGVEWREPYPYTSLPYSTEVSFGRLDQDTDGTGELVLARIVNSRLGHFKSDLLDQQSFLLGEDIRSGGAWAQPERWGTWLCHSGGDIVFSLAPEPSEFYYVFLRLRVSGLLDEQPVRLLANGERLWVGKIGPKSKDVALRIRKRAGATSPWKLQIAAEVDLSPEIRGQIIALDSRLPTIGFERFILVPENDLNARLDVMSNMVLSMMA